MMPKTARKAPNPRSLHKYCHKGDLQKVKELIPTDCSSRALEILEKQAGLCGYTPLHEATSRRRHDVVKHLLLCGAKVNARSYSLYTPLHIAASIGDSKCVEILLEYGADVNLEDKDKKTPWKAATDNRCLKSAMLLKTAEIKHKIKEKDQESELGNLLECVQPGKEVTDTCIEECLLLAVRNNHHYATGFLILHNPTNAMQCLQEAMMSHDLLQTAALLLSYVAVKNDDKILLMCLCHADFNHHIDVQSSNSVIRRAYLPNKGFSLQQLHDIRTAIKNIEMAFLVSLAVKEEKFDCAGILLFNLFCTKSARHANWNDLALTRLDDNWMDHLHGYAKLSLRNNLIKRLPNKLLTMESLIRLDLSHNKLRILPKELFELPRLGDLNLSHNLIEKLPEILRWTGSLRVLDLQENLLESFPDCVSGVALRYLNMANNRFVDFPMSVCQMLTLNTLDVSGNKGLHDLPAELGRLASVTDLRLTESQLRNLPPEIREEAVKIIRYLYAKFRSSVECYVMKLLIIGQAKTGKTTLLHRMKGDDAFNLSEATQGIDVHELELRRSMSVPPFHFRCWDFGGQDEYCAVHHCFLSHRSLYLLLWDVTGGEMGVSSLKPWLDNLSTIVPGASVIIVGTKLDRITEPLEVYEKRMTDKFRAFIDSAPNCKQLHIKKFVFVSCSPLFKDTKRRIEQLKRFIYDVAAKMTKMTRHGDCTGVRIMGERIPSSYIDLEKEVEEECRKRRTDGKLPVLRREEFLDLFDRVSSKNKKDCLTRDDVVPATEFLLNKGIPSTHPASTHPASTHRAPTLPILSPLRHKVPSTQPASSRSKSTQPT